MAHSTVPDQHRLLAMAGRRLPVGLLHRSQAARFN
jgi:hypothetical protein